MTSKVTITAESHPCEVRELPVHEGDVMPWERLSPETQRFARHPIRVGDEREFHVHQGKALLVMEQFGPERCSHREIIAEADSEVGECRRCGATFRRSLAWEIEGARHD